VRKKSPIAGIPSASFPVNYLFARRVFSPGSNPENALQPSPSSPAISSAHQPSQAFVQMIGRSGYHPTLIGYSNFWSAYTTLALKTTITITCVVIATLLRPLLAADARTDRIIRKADEILAATEVVSNTAVGYAGECPEANWALSVICASHKDPVAHLLELSERCRPAGYIMCLLGVKTIDENRYAAEIARHREEIGKAKWTLEFAIGCSIEKSTGIDVIDQTKSWQKQQILCERIPELWDTIRLEAQIEDIERAANKAAEPTRTTVTPPAGAGDRASGARGSP
jgi:hypothetical protein